MSIEVTNLTRRYGDQKAVDDISFRVGQGEIVGFLGPNGAGKSTTMKLIAGYLRPDTGSASVGGINVQTNPLQTKRKIGYLPEGNPLYYDMYVKEYLDFVADIHAIKNKKQRIKEIIDTVGLTPESHKRTGQLSKGFKQRVGLAATLLHDPEALILDEPTTGLDPNQVLGIRELIRSLGKNKTVLFSSHILQEVEAVCDRVVIISKGKIVANDSLANLQRSRSGSCHVMVQFNEAPDTALFSDSGIISAVDVLDNGVYRFHTSRPEAVRKEILELCLRHNLNIVSLQTGEHSLEEIFRELTAGNNVETKE